MTRKSEAYATAAAETLEKVTEVISRGDLDGVTVRPGDFTDTLLTASTLASLALYYQQEERNRVAWLSGPFTERRHG